MKGGIKWSIEGQNAFLHALAHSVELQVEQGNLIFAYNLIYDFKKFQACSSKFYAFNDYIHLSFSSFVNSYKKVANKGVGEDLRKSFIEYLINDVKSSSGFKYNFARNLLINILRIEKTNLDSNHHIKSLIEIAIAREDLTLLEALENEYEIVNKEIDGDGQTPIYFAVYGNKVNAVKKLISMGAYVNYQNNVDETPLHLAAGDNELNHITKLLLDNGADPNIVEMDGDTPLHRACEADNYVAIKYLLEDGADKNIEGSDNSTALEIAFNSGDDEIINLLNHHQLKKIYGSHDFRTSAAQISEKENINIIHASNNNRYDPGISGCGAPGRR